MTEQREPRRSTAAGWERWNDWNARNMAAVMGWLCRGAGVSAGRRVLDVACGVGLPALPAAELVGPGGSVVGVDVSREMLDAAERIARQRGARNVQFLQMDAHDLEFPEASFDAVTFSFGLMFCADRARVLAGIRRVLAPSGWLALSVWDDAAKNPFFTTVFETLERFVPPPPGPRGPGMFSLGNPESLARLLEEAGFGDLAIESVPMQMEFESLAQHWRLFADMAPPVNAAEASLPASELEALKDALAEKLRPFRQGEGVRVLATALCARGRKV